MFSQASKGFGERREVIIPPFGQNSCPADLSDRRGGYFLNEAVVWVAGEVWAEAEGAALVLAAVAPDGRREDRETDDKGACGTVSWKGSFLYVAGGWAGFDRGNKAVHYRHMRAFHSGSRRQKTPRPAKRTGRPIILYIPECRWRRLSDRH